MPSPASHSCYMVKCYTQRAPHVATAMVRSVLIADDNAFVRQRLGELFSREPDFEVCGEAENGLDVARVMKRVMPKVPFIIFSAYSDSFTEKEARSAGVSALVSKFEDM